MTAIKNFFTIFTITCSKSTIELIGQSIKYVKVNNWGSRTTSMLLLCGISCWLWTCFTPSSNTSIVEFEHVKSSGTLQKFYVFKFEKNICAPWPQRKLKISHNLSSDK